MGLQKGAESQSDSPNGTTVPIPCEEGSHKDDLTDGRELGHWESRFCCSAWCQILAELLYLVVVLAAGSVLLFDATVSGSAPAANGIYVSPLFGLSINQDHLKWIALWVAGMMGGSVFALKWLYHAVARGSWNRDRILWRFIVPFNSATVALFTGFLFSSGAVPFLKEQALDTPLMTLAFGFIFGCFSDNILAALQKFAKGLFGTLGDG